VPHGFRFEAISREGGKVVVVHIEIPGGRTAPVEIPYHEADEFLHDVATAVSDAIRIKLELDPQGFLGERR
jgi:hypothetical protein